MAGIDVCVMTSKKRVRRTQQTARGEEQKNRYSDVRGVRSAIAAPLCMPVHEIVRHFFIRCRKPSASRSMYNCC